MLDIGSNSAQLQVVEVYPGSPPLPAHAVKAATRLGECFGSDGSILPEGVDRLVASVDEAMDAARRCGVERLVAFATSAVRDSANRGQILERIREAAGLIPQFLAGEDEARLTYLAARRWYGWSTGRLLVLDVGGGSLEIALGRDVQPEVALSLPLGAGRLTRAFLPDDPPDQTQVKRLRRHVRDTLSEASDRLRWEGCPALAVATSKTFKQLARLAGAPRQRKGPFARRTLAVQDLERWIPRLERRTAEQRAKLRGVSGPRARQILAGAVVAQQTMQTLGISSVEICPWALREGVTLCYLETSFSGIPMLPIQPVDLDTPAQPGNVHRLPGLTGEPN